MEKKALGRGLATLLPVSETTALGSAQTIHTIPLTHILPNRFQPRQTFDDQDLKELADSIKQHGILQPILLRRKGDGRYELIAGERRFRAAKLAKLSALPAVIRHSKDEESTILALVENIQRADLNPIEEAKAYRRMRDEFGLTQEAVADRVGRDRASVANISRILSLPSDVQDMVASHQLTLGHAKVILGLKNAASQLSVAQRILRDRLSVRQAERFIKREGSPEPRRDRDAHKAYPRLSSSGDKPSRRASGMAAWPETRRDLEDRLRTRLGTKVAIRSKKQGGELILRYYAEEELTRIVDVILK